MMNQIGFDCIDFTENSRVKRPEIVATIPEE